MIFILFPYLSPGAPRVMTKEEMLFWFQLQLDSLINLEEIIDSFNVSGSAVF